MRWYCGKVSGFSALKFLSLSFEFRENEGRGIQGEYASSKVTRTLSLDLDRRGRIRFEVECTGFVRKKIGRFGFKHKI